VIVWIHFNFLKKELIKLKKLIMEKEFSSIQNRQDLVQLPMVDTLVPHQEQQENVTSETHLNQPVIIREDPSKYDETEDGKKDSLDGEKKRRKKKDKYRIY